MLSFIEHCMKVLQVEEVVYRTDTLETSFCSHRLLRPENPCNRHLLHDSAT